MAQFMAGHYRSGYNTRILVRPAGQSTWSLIFMLLYIISSTKSEAIPGCETVNECVYPGDKLTYNCTVQGSLTGATIWNGTAFSGCPQDDIVLQHHQFTQPGGSTGTCNNGDIVGQSLGVQGNSYTSQLNVTITPQTAGKTITCAYDALTTTQDGIIRFSIITPGLLPPPNKLYISTADFISRHLTFGWSPVAPDCPAVHYQINASNCGNCPTTTNHTNVTCTDVPAENSVCTFAIQTVLCRTLIGNKSDPVIVTTRAKIIVKETVSLSTLIPGGLMLFLAVVLITGCILYVTLTKRSQICSQRNKFQVPLQTSEEVGNMVYSVCERPSSNRFMNNTNKRNSSRYKEAPLELNSLLNTLQDQVSDSQWYQFGVAISVPRRVLNQIENYSEESRLAEVLDYWLKHHPGQPSWTEIMDAQRKIGPADSVDVYSCLDTPIPDNGKDNKPSKTPRCTSSVNKPESLYSQDVYDKTFHRN